MNEQSNAKMNQASNEAAPARKPYCRPWSAGLASAPEAVAKRIVKLIEGLRELDANLVEGTILDDIREFRIKILGGLERDGWTWSYDGGNKLKVRKPGHPKPFARKVVG